MLTIKNVDGWSSGWGDGVEYEIVLCSKCYYDILSVYSVELGRHY
jgi:hypothetical protein